VAEARMNQAGQGQMAEEAILHETP
jgi:hypothetical protein